MATRKTWMIGEVIFYQQAMIKDIGGIMQFFPVMH
jgi:hypothetical protein